MERGDHLISARTGYSHHGLYVGRNQVIHYNGSSTGDDQSGTVVMTLLDEFCQGNNFTVQTYPFRMYSREESIERAKSRLGENLYNVLLNNCEHFVTWCILGIPMSGQVTNKVAALVIATEVLKPAPLQPILLALKMAGKTLVGNPLTRATSLTALEALVSEMVCSSAGITAASAISAGSAITAGAIGVGLAPASLSIAAVATLGAGVVTFIDHYLDL